MRHDTTVHSRQSCPQLRIVGQSRLTPKAWPGNHLDSKPLTAAAYVLPRRQLYLHFDSGEVYRHFTFPDEKCQKLLDSDSHGHYFLSCIPDRFPCERLARR